MKRTNIRWSLQGFALSLVLCVGGLAGAVEPDEDGELIFNSEFMVMNSFGDDIHVFTVKFEDDGTGDSTNNAVDLESDSDFGWRGDLMWKEGAWGMGISGFHYDDKASESLRIDGEEADEVSIKSPFEGPDCNTAQFCVARATSDLEVWLVDLYGIRELVATPDAGVDLQFGLRLAGIDWEASGASATIDDVTNALEGDNAAWSARSESDDVLAGPFLSLLSKGRYGRFHLEGQLTQAVVFGDYNLRSAGHQLDTGTIWPDFTIEETNTRTRDEEVVIPITDVRIKLGYEVIDNLTLGFGAYATTWFNVPSPPNSTANSLFGANSAIDSDEETLTFLGASFSIAYRFATGGLFPW